MGEQNVGFGDDRRIGECFDQIGKPIDGAGIRFIFEIVFGDVELVIGEPAPRFGVLFFGFWGVFVVRIPLDKRCERGFGLRRRFSVALPRIGQNENIARHELVVAIGRLIRSIGDFAVRRIRAYERLIAYGCLRIVAAFAVSVGNAQIAQRRPARRIGVFELDGVKSLDGIFVRSAFERFYRRSVVGFGIALGFAFEDGFVRCPARCRKKQ